MKRETWKQIGIMLLMIAVGALLALLFMPTGQACTELPPSTQFVEYTDTTYWAVDAETRELAGMLRPCEDVPTLPVQDVHGRIRGFLPGGFSIRVAARLKVFSAGGLLLGMTAKDDTVIRIRPELLPVVQEIVWREIGEGTMVCGGSVSTCILHMGADSTITERLATQYAGAVSVGFVYFNVDITAGDYVEIVVCDWDGDGSLDLCLMTGSAPEPVKTPEPEPEVSEPDKPACERQEPAAAKPASQECWKLEIEFNFHVLLQHCKKIFGT